MKRIYARRRTAPYIKIENVAKLTIAHLNVSNTRRHTAAQYAQQLINVSTMHALSLSELKTAKAEPQNKQQIKMIVNCETRVTRLAAQLSDLLNEILNDPNSGLSGLAIDQITGRHTELLERAE